MKHGLHWLDKTDYDFVCNVMPIPCVDLVILRHESALETLLIKRKKGYEAGKWCLIGGRAWIYEPLSATIKRQADDLGVKVEVMSPFNANFPAYVNDHPNQDKTKNPRCLVYPVRIVSGQLRPEGEEYTAYQWFPIKHLPDMGYEHKNEIKQTINKLQLWVD